MDKIYEESIRMDKGEGSALVQNNIRSFIADKLLYNKEGAYKIVSDL